MIASNRSDRQAETFRLAGFSLIELLVVIAIIAVLAAINVGKMVPFFDA